MGDVAAPEDQHALAAKLMERPRELEVLLPAQLPIEAELHDGHIGRGHEVSQHRPGTVVESPVILDRRVG